MQQKKSHSCSIYKRDYFCGRRIFKTSKLELYSIFLHFYWCYFFVRQEYLKQNSDNNLKQFLYFLSIPIKVYVIHKSLHKINLVYMLTKIWIFYPISRNLHKSIFFLLFTRKVWVVWVVCFLLNALLNISFIY